MHRYSPFPIFLLLIGSMIQTSLAHVTWPTSHPHLPHRYYETQGTKGAKSRMYFEVIPPQVVAVNSSTLAWGTQKVLNGMTTSSGASTDLTGSGLVQLFKEMLTQKPGGWKLAYDVLFSFGEAAEYPALLPNTLADFLSTFEPGKENDARMQDWQGQQRAPHTSEGLPLPAGGSELVVPAGQIVDVQPGMKIRIETDGTLMTWADGTITHCVGGCGQSRWEHRMKNGDTKNFHVDPLTEFIEIQFQDQMRIIYQAERNYVLYVPSDEPLVAEKRPFWPKEKINTAAWAELGPGYVQGGVRECERGREYEGEGSENRDAKYCEQPSILQFIKWSKKIGGPFPESLPPRPLTTVWDFTKELFAFQAAHEKRN